MRLAVIPGDGIGPILMAQARRVLEKLLAAELAVGRVELRDIEGLTIENRTAQGKAIPDEVLAAIKNAGFKDAVHVQGGVLAWAAQVDPSLPTY